MPYLREKESWFIGFELVSYRRKAGYEDESKPAT